MAGEGDRRAGPEVDGRAARRSSAAGARRRPPRRRDRAREHGRLLRARRRRGHARAGLARGAGDVLRLGRVRASFPEIARAFMLNVKIFCIAEVFILVVRAAARGDPQPARAGVLPAARARDRLRRLLPRRADDPRDRDPRLRRAGARSCSGVPTSTTFWGIVALVLVYTRVRLGGLPRGDRVGAPVAGGGRALARAHARRRRCGYVILPQAVRRVIPPLLNDFIGLQKDTALVGMLGAIEAFNQSQIDTERDLQLHAVPRRGGALRRDHDPARALHRLADPARPPPAAGGGRARERRRSRSRACASRSGELEVLRGIDLDGRRARGRLPDRRVGLGQVDAAALRQPDRADRRAAGSSSTGEEITRRGVDVNRVRRRIGIVFQAFNLFPHMTRAAQRHARAAGGARPVARRGRGARPRAARALRPRRQGATSIPTASRAASSSASRSCARSRWSPS